jgi:hypothetical protein
MRKETRLTEHTILTISGQLPRPTSINLGSIDRSNAKHLQFGPGRENDDGSAQRRHLGPSRCPACGFVIREVNGILRALTPESKLFGTLGSRSRSGQDEGRLGFADAGLRPGQAFPQERTQVVGNYSTVGQINSLGVMAGDYQITFLQGYLTFGSHFLSFDYPDSAISGLRAVNDRCEVAGYFAFPGGPVEAYIAIPREE